VDTISPARGGSFSKPFRISLIVLCTFSLSTVSYKYDIKMDSISRLSNLVLVDSSRVMISKADVDRVAIIFFHTNYNLYTIADHEAFNVTPPYCDVFSFPSSSPHIRNDQKRRINRSRFIGILSESC
jgi:hypothetical protein